MDHFKMKLESVASDQEIARTAKQSNEIVDLATILEPLYWPDIIGHRSLALGISQPQYEQRLAGYREQALKLVTQLDCAVWRGIHRDLRVKAAWMDDNPELYVFLRLGSWERREKLKGAVGGALWIRHLAEVVRRGFEQARRERWAEEDEAFGVWHTGARDLSFGSERPLDHVLQCRPYLAEYFGLFTGSTVRWYVEGETEYYAITELLPQPALFGIELVNLRGNIETGRDNAALKLEEWLKEDEALRRFSLISFDRDVAANEKAIRRQLDQSNVVGFIAAHQPDFEFANFDVSELAEIAAGIDEAHGYPGDTVRNADWSGVSKGRDFSRNYVLVSARRPSGLKGAEWGRALAACAAEHPSRPYSGGERPLWRQIGVAVRGRTANYDFQKAHFTFDRETFEQVRTD